MFAPDSAPEQTGRRAVIGSVLVVATMPIVFLILAAVFGDRLGWILGFVVYWVVWGFWFPLWLLGAPRVRELLAATSRWPGPVWSLLLLGPPLGSVAMNWTTQRVNFAVVAFAVVFALINGTAEELLWRGVFVSAFPRRWWWGLVYPSLAFGIWHLAPQLIDPAAGSPIPFAAAAVVLGLLYGSVAQRTGSVRWTTVSHILADLLALETFVNLLR